MKQTCFFLASALAALVVAVPASQAATLSLYQEADLSHLGLGTYSGVDNLTLIEGVGGNNFSSRNYGNSSTVTIGRDNTNGERRGLLRFDLSSLNGVIDNITSVTLTVTLMNLSNSNAGNVAFNLYEIESANAGWVQGTGTGSAQAGSSAWNFKGIPGTGVPAVNWAGSAGLYTQGVDYVNQVIDGTKTGIGGVSGVTGTVVTWQLPVGLIEAWIDGDNAGLLFAADQIGGLAQSDFFAMAASKNDNAAYRPTLTIGYSPIPEPGTVGLLLGSATLLGLLRGIRRHRA